MSKKTATVWHENGFDLMADAESPYYLLCIKEDIEIIKKPIRLKTGDVIDVGGTLAYLGSKKTSAGFDNLHPIAPGLFEYVGMIDRDDDTYVLWECGIDFKGEFIAVYYAHSVLNADDGAIRALFYANRAGSGRVIEADIFHATHETIPQELYPLPYRKQMGWVA